MFTRLNTGVLTDEIGDWGGFYSPPNQNFKNWGGGGVGGVWGGFGQNRRGEVGF